jgi:hypothetical protein
VEGKVEHGMEGKVEHGMEGNVEAKAPTMVTDKVNRPH